MNLPAVAAARVRLRRIRRAASVHAPGIADSVEQIHAAATVERQPASTVDPSATGSFDWLQRFEHPATFRATISHARVAGREPLVCTNDYIAVRESAVDDEQLQANPAMRQRLPIARRLPGTVMVMVGPWHTSHYHWVTDHLPRLALLPVEEQPDLPLLVHADLDRSQLASLAALGVSENRLIRYSHPHVRVERAIWPSLPGRTGNMPHWAVEWLRERVAPRRGRGQRIVYISRADVARRVVVNEQDVVAALRDLGAETVLPGELTFAQQVDLFADARLIIGAHGAGLTNMVFARDATIVEVLDPRHVNGCFYTLANASGHRYWHLLGNPSAGDGMTIDIALLRETVERALGEHSYTRAR